MRLDLNLVLKLWSEGLLDLPFQGPALLEVSHLPGGYRYRLPGLGIPALSCRSGSDPENPEIPELDGIAGFQTLLHGRQEEVKHDPGVFIPNPRELTDQALYQIGFCHWAPFLEILFFGQDPR